ncbi:MAG: sigma 54-interacting transcriptional regulator [Oceanospirillaceae bacterium]
MDFEYRGFYLSFPSHLAFPDFSRLGWKNVTINHLGKLQRPRENNIRVGVYYIDEEDLSDDSFKKLFIHYPNVNWIAIVSENGIKSPLVRQKIASWFYDYHTLPLDENRLLFSLGRAYGMSNLNQNFECNSSWTNKMVGKSAAMQQLYLAMNKLSNCNVPVLISGESGTGKELVAQAIHASSHYANGAIIELNCGALPRELIQSELFGHEKGAFTGATQRVIGCVEAANGGTLFLDEVGDLPLDLQANLLRVLQEGVVQRVGSHTRVPVDVRIIAATHVNLEQAVIENRFRQDLFYRLSVVPLEVPTLRNRGSDIELLAKHFLSLFRTDAITRITGFSRCAICAIRIHPWPGNVRELINRVRRAIIMTENSTITAIDLGLTQPEEQPLEVINLDLVRAKVEREAIERALHISNSNVSSAAQLLGISRRTLYRLIDKHCCVTTAN